MTYQESYAHNYKHQLLWTAVAIFVSVVAAVTVSALLVNSLINDRVAAVASQQAPVSTQVAPANLPQQPATYVQNGNNCDQPAVNNQQSYGKGGAHKLQAGPTVHGNAAVIYNAGGKGGGYAKSYSHPKVYKSSTVNKTTNNKVWQKTTYNKTYTKNSNNAYDSNNSYESTKVTNIEDSFNKDSYNNVAVDSYNKDSNNKTYTDNSKTTVIKNEDSFNTTVNKDSYNTKIEDSFNKTYNKNSNNTNLTHNKDVDIEDSFNKEHTKKTYIKNEHNKTFIKKS